MLTTEQGVRLEILGILQEECAETIQAVSKIRRSGENFKPFDGEKTNRNLLDVEIEDVGVLIWLYRTTSINGSICPQHFKPKLRRVQKWGSLHLSLFIEKIMERSDGA